MLGAVYADLFPHRVATMVLDGAVDVNAPLTQQAAQEAPAAERSLDHLFATCPAGAGCPLGADPEAPFYRALAASLTGHPLPAPGYGDTYPVTVGDLDTATLLALSVPRSPRRTTRRWWPPGTATAHRCGPWPSSFDIDIDGLPWSIPCGRSPATTPPSTRGRWPPAAWPGPSAASYPLIGAYAVTTPMGGCVPGRQAASR